MKYLPLLMIAAFGFFYSGYRIGLSEGIEAGVAQERAAKAKADQSMVDMGFCEWTRKVRWAQKCQYQQVMQRN